MVLGRCRGLRPSARRVDPLLRFGFGVDRVEDLLRVTYHFVPNRFARFDRLAKARPGAGIWEKINQFLDECIGSLGDRIPCQCSPKVLIADRLLVGLVLAQAIKYIGQGDCIEPKAFPLKNGVSDSIAKLVPAR